MRHLGTCIGLAFKDLETKSNCVKNNRILLNEKLGFINSKEAPEYKSVLKFIKLEQELGI